VLTKIGFVVVIVFRAYASWQKRVEG